MTDKAPRPSERGVVASGQRPANSPSAPFWVNFLGFALSRAQFPGKYRVACRLGAAVSRVCPEAECQTNPGCRFSVQLSDRIQRLMWAGCYETELVALLKEMLRPGMVFVDVGANVGYFSAIGASLVGPQGSVYSFEADPDCSAKLRQNTAPYPWACVLHAAVGDKPGECTFFRSNDPQESGWGTTLPNAEDRERISVPAVTLDGELTSRKLRRLDLIKLDVEGAEYRVLRGAEGTIAAFRPLVYFELNPACLARDGVTTEALLGYLCGKEYEIWMPPGPDAIALLSALAIPVEKTGEMAKATAAKFRRRPLGSASRSRGGE